MEDEETIEEWFEDTKEKLVEEYYETIHKGIDLKKAKDDFEKKIKKVLADYEKRYDKMWSDIEKSESLHKPINELKKKKQKAMEKFNRQYSMWKKDIIEHNKKLLEDTEKKKVSLELRWLDFWKDLWSKR